MSEYDESGTITDCSRTDNEYYESKYVRLANTAVELIKSIADISIEECNRLCEESMKHIMNEHVNGLKIDDVLRNSLQKVSSIQNDTAVPIFMASVCLSLAIKSMYENGFVLTLRSKASIIKVVHVDGKIINEDDMETIKRLYREVKGSSVKNVYMIHRKILFIYKITNTLPKIYV